MTYLTSFSARLIIRFKILLNGLVEESGIQSSLTEEDMKSYLRDDGILKIEMCVTR